MLTQLHAGELFSSTRYSRSLTELLGGTFLGSRKGRLRKWHI
jgi:hypothetical protein